MKKGKSNNYKKRIIPFLLSFIFVGILFISKIKNMERIMFYTFLIGNCLYYIIGIILAFKSNEAIQLLFYVIGILVIVYGVKSLIDYYKNKNMAQFKNVNLTIAIVSIILGVLLIILSETLEISIRYILGFFLIYMGISRLLTSISFNNYKNWSTISNILLILLGLYSIFISNAILVFVGWILIINAVILFIDYWRK